MKYFKVDLIAVAGQPNQYPETELPEVAFVGRSNVGKSSLINKLVNRKGIARKSGKPGKTRTINFYQVDDEFILADLPGYGYASASMAEKEAWGKNINKYLGSRKNLLLVVMIIDSRQGLTSNDLMMYEWLRHSEINFVVAMNKIDKISKSEAAKTRRQVEEQLEGMANVYPVSCFKGDGIDILRDGMYISLGLIH